MANRAEGRAFTIVELLVVISIVALLAALLTPTLLSAKMAGYRSSCQGNLRQISVAFNLYCNDFDDRFPTAVDQYWKDHASDWRPPSNVNLTEAPDLIEALACYAGGDAVFHCPSDTQPFGRVINEHVVSMYPSVFAYDRSSYQVRLPQIIGRPQSRFALSSLVVAFDLLPWHCDYNVPQFYTPAYNFLYGDGHVRFESLQQAANHVRGAAQ